MNTSKRRGNHQMLVKALMIAFDAVAVNLAYFMALILRFYVKFEFNSGAQHYIPIFWQTVPFFALACVVIFYAFKLYNTMWEFGGLRDLNRILIELSRLMSRDLNNLHEVCDGQQACAWQIVRK